MNFVIIDSRGNFCSDITSRLAIDDDIEITVVATLTGTDRINTVTDNVDAVIIADNVIEQADFAMPTIAPCFAYLTKQDGEQIIAQSGIPYIGNVNSAKSLINILETFNPNQFMQAQQGFVQQMQPAYTNMMMPTTMPQETQQVAPADFNPQMQQGYLQPTITPQSYSQPIGQPYQTMPQQSYPQPMQGYPQQTTSQQGFPQPMQNFAQPMQPAPVQPTNDAYTPPNDVEPEENEINDIKKSDVKKNKKKEKIKKEPEQKKNVQPTGKTKKELETTEEAIYIDDNNTKTKVVTVYSAKGGVGKTTLSSEIATYLSLTCKKRGKLKVCIVDYNIDFGDVTTTLGFAPDGVNMCLWASEIYERIENGENPDDIKYDEREIKQNFLQTRFFTDDTELYGLLAPSNHEDSMFVKEEALQVMLRNIVENGNFDFVICDTGNNTRDSSIIALDCADYVFLVVTQDITTINCNDSFLSTMRQMEFDESRVSVIINNIRSAKDTSISVHDIESFVKFPCIAHIKSTADIIKANNKSQPLVLKANHEFTKELRNIILFLINDGEIPAEEKGGFLSNLFKRK